jgi:hypothetical protein
MANKRDWIPATDIELAAFARAWKEGLQSRANAEAFGWELHDLELVMNRIDVFLAAWAACSSSNSTGKHLAKDMAREAMKDAMRDFASQSICFNRLMTGEQKLRYGISRDIRPKASPPLLSR